MSGALTVIIAGGGTGGHLFPGIALAEALLRLRPDVRVSFVGSRNKIEARVVPQLGYEFDAVWIAGLTRGVSLKTLLLPVKLLVSLLQSALIIRRRKPDVVVGTGGYASGPLLYAAARLGRKTLIHEQNEFPGITTRKLAPLADEVHVTYESSAEYLKQAKRIVMSGNPVRLSLTRKDGPGSREAFGLNPFRPTLLVFGGSLGASSVNRAVRALVPRLVREDYQLIWQTGRDDYEDLKSIGALYQGQVVVKPFIDEMDTAYSAASLVLCRAGATSLAEITVLGLPCILIPYPRAAADHQKKNAQAMATAGAAVTIEDNKLERLEGVLFGLLQDEGITADMAAASLAQGRPDAAFDIAEAVIRLAETEQA